MLILLSQRFIRHLVTQYLLLFLTNLIQLGHFGENGFTHWLPVPLCLILGLLLVNLSLQSLFVFDNPGPIDSAVSLIRHGFCLQDIDSLHNLRL